MSTLDRHANAALPRARHLTEREETPVDLIQTAAALLEQHGPQSSECRATADRLRRLVRALAAAQRAERMFTIKPQGEGR